MYTFYFLLHLILKYTYRRFKLRNIIRNSKFRLFDLTKLKKNMSSVFILGSGSSLNKLGKKEWDVIKKSTSIGFNFSVIHDFVPDIYFFELPRISKDRSKLLELLRANADRYSQTVIIAKDIKKSDFEYLKSMKFNILIPIDLNFAADNYSELNKSIKIIKYLQKKKRLPKSILLKKRSTLVMIILLSWRLEFKQIVLCGVDLNNSSYFYESTRYSKIKHLIPTVNRSLVHKTVDPNYGRLTTDTIIYEINNLILKHYGVKLFTAFESSLLNREIDSYFK